MTKQSSAGGAITNIMNHFRLVTFFCLFIIIVTYFLMYLNYEKIKAVSCDEFGHYPEKSHRDVFESVDLQTDTDKLPQIQDTVDQNENIVITKDKLALLDKTLWGAKYTQNPTRSDFTSESENNEGGYKTNTQHLTESIYPSSYDEAKANPSSLPMKQSTSQNEYNDSTERGKSAGQSETVQNYALENNNNIPDEKSSFERERIIPQYTVGDSTDVSIDDLSHTLEDRIKIASSIMRRAKTKPGCVANATIANSCDDDNCLRMHISEDPRERISELITPKELQLSYGDISTLVNMRGQVAGLYDIVLLTAASSNHFLESQALLKNLHETLYPHLKNFVLIYYDIGLTPEERKQLEKFCKCTVVDFPFEEVPEFVKNLKCYSWKPMMIKAHVEQGNVLVWMDASVRFQNVEDFNQLIERTRRRGFQMAGPSEKSPFRTVRSMYHFFGEEPCAYLQMGQLHATAGLFKRDPFVNRAILEPWTACALNKSCMCPANVQQKISANSEMIRKWREEGGPMIYGQMHRFDQSAISLIIHKLFYKYYPYVLFDKVRYNVQFLRRDVVQYFPSTNNEGGAL